MTVKEGNQPKKIIKSQSDLWNEINIPTLTNKIDHRVQNTEDFSLDIIENFIPSFNTETGHQENCSCIKCQPKKAYETSTIVTAVQVEKNIQPLNKNKYDK